MVWAGSRSRYSLSAQKRKKQRSAAIVRAWLEGEGRCVASLARKRRSIEHGRPVSGRPWAGCLAQP